MTFFDKLFTIRSRTSKRENGLRFAIEPLRSSLFDVAKDQIRVVLFRECDRQGRKLLFDSNAVEKLPLGSHIKTNDFLCKTKGDKLQNGKLFDFVEVTHSHGYKYKKPSNDVTLLGEMIFGSVAMVFKGGNTCKIHSLSTPKCVMFTNIIHAPGQCHYKLSGDCFIGVNSGFSSETSLNDYSDDKRVSSSDSKLYKTQTSSKCGTSTYPCIKQKQHNKNVLGLHEIDKYSSDNWEKCVLNENVNENYLEKIRSKVGENCERLPNLDSKLNCESESNSVWDCSELYQNLSEKKELGQSMCPADTSGSFIDFNRCKRDTIYSASANDMNSSMSGLRRRWMQSCSSSVDEVHQEEADDWKNKTRTKLGMGLVVDLSHSLDNELEKFLFNHTIVIESILKKLQSSVEFAYIKKENFVDLIYMAFVNCQQSMYELINGGKYARPMWLTLNGSGGEESGSNTLNKIYSQFHENIKDCKKQDTLNSVQIQFLNDFCDVLVKFDTKDTNFFISTLVTAVLTHHLSWVTGMDESDVSLPQHMEQSKVKGPYNPIWAQLNDLNGILGSPLKSARTVITGSEASRSSIASIVQALTYFIRCYNVVENVYDFEFEEVTRVDDEVLKFRDRNVTNFGEVNGGNSSLCTNVPTVRKDLEKPVDSKRGNIWPWAEVNIPSTRNFQDSHNLTSEELHNCPRDGIRKSRSCLFRSEGDGSYFESATLYPDIDELSKMESIRIVKSEYQNCDSQANNCSKVDNYTEKVQKLIRVPSEAVLCHLEKDPCWDEGCDVVDSSVVSSICNGNDFAEKRDDVLFVLGENEELVNLNRSVARKADSKIMESKNQSTDFKNLNLPRSKSVNIAFSVAEESEVNCRTFSNDSRGKDVSSPEHYFAGLEKESILSVLQELPMPRVSESNRVIRRLDISSVLGSVNEHYNSEQIIQGVLEDKSQWEKALQRDLALHAHNPVLDKNVTEAMCIIGDMNTWEVSLFSNRNFTMDRRNYSGVRVGMSQLVADMLESLLHICRIRLPPDFCLDHIEKKLHEIYTKSKSIAELLNSTEMCSMEYLTSRLNISVNDVPLLLSVATTHSPHISSKYGLTFT